jgi:hypothetical protein
MTLLMRRLLAVTSPRALRPCSCRHVHNLPSQVPCRIIFGSCSDETEDLGYWHRFSDLQPDLVVLMGDNVYNHNLKEAYQVLGQHPSFQKAREELCILATLDDNDYGNEGDACCKNPAK